MLTLRDLRLADVMTSSPLCFTLDTPVEEACRTLLEEGVLAAPVCDQDSERLFEVSVSALLEFVTSAERAGFEPTLRDLSLEPALCLSGEVSLPEVCQEMIRRGARRVLIRRGGEPAGILSSTDVVRAIACLESCNQTPLAGNPTLPSAAQVRDLMRRDIVSVAPEESVHDLLRMLHQVDLGSLCVTRAGVLVGIVTRQDALAFCAEGLDPQAQQVWSLMTPSPLVTLDQDEPLARSLGKLREHATLPVLSGALLVGVLTRAEVMDHYARSATRRLTRPGPLLGAEVAALVALA